MTSQPHWDVDLEKISKADNVLLVKAVFYWNYCGNVILGLRKMSNLFWGIRIYLYNKSVYFYSKKTTTLNLFSSSHNLLFEKNIFNSAMKCGC